MEYNLKEQDMGGFDERY